MSPLALLLLASTALANMGPPKPLKIISPTLLSECGCTPFLQTVVDCQGIGPSGDAEACICNDSWITGSMACRDCLLLASGSDSKDETQFYLGFEQAITNAFVACTEKGGASVKVVQDSSDGPNPGICAWNVVGWSCVGVGKDATEAWSSEIDRSTKQPVIGRAEIDVALDMKASASASSSTTAGITSTKSSVTATATKTGTATVSAGKQASASSGAGASAAASSEPTSAAADLRLGKSALALMAVAGVVVAAF
ncbi:hypothetical protein FN846DRAFT_515518 [Sphaerosporella brunnea]|uniref:Extracellular membrane protein CFEM domain-containing protein n=1 Tax=Sphaerosporella brunnea TaxID=1250544 RepID=A0A5J5F311_9PEZI|nr:hypothetical protein FN846DRAFT_515518 [Sphaerosporella brunnea]